MKSSSGYPWQRLCLHQAYSVCHSRIRCDEEFVVLTCSVIHGLVPYTTVTPKKRCLAIKWPTNDDMLMRTMRVYLVLSLLSDGSSSPTRSWILLCHRDFSLPIFIAFPSCCVDCVTISNGGYVTDAIYISCDSLLLNGLLYNLSSSSFLPCHTHSATNIISFKLCCA